MHNTQHYHASLYELVNGDGKERLWKPGHAYADRDTAEANVDRLSREMPIDAIAYYEYRTRACGDDCEMAE